MRVETALDIQDQTAPDILDQTAPDILDQTAPDILYQNAPDILDQTAPDILYQTVPDILDQTAPDMLKNTQIPLGFGGFRVSLCGETSKLRVAVNLACWTSPLCPTNSYVCQSVVQFS